jgi:serine/threonine protein kinase
MACASASIRTVIVKSTSKSLLFPSGILQRGASARDRGSTSSSATSWVSRGKAPVDDDDDPGDEKTLPFIEALVGPVNPLVPPFGPGDVIANKYRVEEVLGCGGMAWVLRATHVQLNQKVALKFLRFAATHDAVARFFQEGRAAARVSSDAVTRILDVDTLPDGQPFLVMEYLDGRDLEKVVGDPGWIPVTTAIDFTIQACEGLAEVHAAGIVHRDLKPANLFLTRKRNGSIRMKLLDFGISKFAAGVAPLGKESPVTSTQALMGSPVYMAPEQMRSSKNVDARADIWSLGVILYELLSGGRSPFQGETLPEVCTRVMREQPEPLEAIRTDLPDELHAVVSRCLEKDPSRRFTSAASLALALAPFASSDGQLLARRMQRRASSPPSPRKTPPESSFAVPAASARVPTWTAPAAQPTPTPRLALAKAPWSPSTLASNPPASVPAPVLPLGSRNAWVAVALSAVLVGVSAASFAAGVRMSLPTPAPSMPSASPPPHVSMGMTNLMPGSAASARLPPPAVLVELPEPTERVYAPEELPLARPNSKGRRP